MSISYIYISFINIKTCDACIIKCEWANKNLHFNDGGGGGGGGGEENTKTTYIHDHFGERKYKNLIFTIIIFLGGGAWKWLLAWLVFVVKVA